MKYKTNHSGFTLIELMITVAIVAILAALALPSYQSSMAKSDRAVGISDIQQISLSQERFYSANRQYTDDFQELNMAAATSATFTDGSGYYDFTIATQNTASNFTIIAVPNKSRDTWSLQLTDKGIKTKKTGTGSWENDWP